MRRVRILAGVGFFLIPKWHSMKMERNSWHSSVSRKTESLIYRARRSLTRLTILRPPKTFENGIFETCNRIYSTNARNSSKKYFDPVNKFRKDFPKIHNYVSPAQIRPNLASCNQHAIFNWIQTRRCNRMSFKKIQDGYKICLYKCIAIWKEKTEEKFKWK